MKFHLPSFLLGIVVAYGFTSVLVAYHFLRQGFTERRARRMAAAPRGTIRCDTSRAQAQLERIRRGLAERTLPDVLDRIARERLN